MDYKNIFLNFITSHIFINIIVSIIIFWIMTFMKENIIAMQYYRRKVSIDHKYETNKKIKNAISKNKQNILRSSDYLADRLWNFFDNHDKKWHRFCDKNLIENIEGDKIIDKLHGEELLNLIDPNNLGYYKPTFVYLILDLYASIRKFEVDMEYMDQEYADKYDIEFFNFIFIFYEVISSAEVFKNTFQDYNIDKAIDHVYKWEMISLCDEFIRNGFSSYKQYKDNSNFFKISFIIMEFISSIEPGGNKWKRFVLLYITLIIFLNKFGYNYHKAKHKQSLQELQSNVNIKIDKNIIYNYLSLLKRYNINLSNKDKKLIKSFGR